MLDYRHLRNRKCLPSTCKMIGAPRHGYTLAPTCPAVADNFSAKSVRPLAFWPGNRNNGPTDSTNLCFFWAAGQRMRFIHTADWHLGRLFHGIHLTEDQAYVLRGQFLDLVRDVKPHAVIIAGDIYDRSVPPTESVELFNELLERLALALRVPVIFIAGNHDSPQRVAFGAKMFVGANVHVFGNPENPAGCVTLEDEHGKVVFYAVPYAEPPMIRALLADNAVTDHDRAMRACLRCIKTADCRSVLIAHGFVAGGKSSDSERLLTVGGSGAVALDAFDGFNYVALGHLHASQSLDDARRVQYCGSPLKYSFSEAEHKKCVHVVEMDAAGACTVKQHCLKPRRDVRCVEGFLTDLLTAPPDAATQEDYLRITLQDTTALLDPIGKLRQVYPNVLEIDRPMFSGIGQTGSGSVDARKLTDADLFNAFFTEVTGAAPDAAQGAMYAETVNQLRQQQRETV